MATKTAEPRSSNKTSALRSWRVWLAVVGTIVLFAVPEVVPNDYVFRIIISIIIDIPLALSQNLITGFGG
ncbi:MAG TPA: hypothetical protein VLC52_12820, partial [Anaerolineae bacterium]|nr:hypothetical protein [Anaerolineae bacterium]